MKKEENSPILVKTNNVTEGLKDSSNYPDTTVLKLRIINLTSENHTLRKRLADTEMALK